MAHSPWHVRHVRVAIYIVGVAAAVGTGLAASLDASTPAEVAVEGRELFGLWALGLLLASMIAGPLAYVLPWNPLNAHLIRGRRALGVCAFGFAVLHAAAFLVPVATAGEWWRLYANGTAWTTGLLLAVPAIVVLGVLAATSRDGAVRALGARRWKRWHRAVYVLLPVVLIHALCLGSDFGFNKAPDAARETDAGCLVGMGLASAAWLALLVARRRHVRWTPARFRRQAT